MAKDKPGQGVDEEQDDNQHDHVLRKRSRSRRVIAVPKDGTGGRKWRGWLVAPAIGKTVNLPIPPPRVIHREN